jgi:hypothetical protein
MLSPVEAPVKIDLWRPVRFPPPEFMHQQSVKSYQDARAETALGHPATLPGKMLTCVWSCDALPPESTEWRVVVDIRQGGVSIAGYPAEYAGPLPAGQPLAQLRIAELFE